MTLKLTLNGGEIREYPNLISLEQKKLLTLFSYKEQYTGEIKAGNVWNEDIKDIKVGMY